jgi:hypothetical protein
MSLLEYIEVRENSKGEWTVSYPDEAYIPCAPICHLKHKHEYEQKLVASHYKPTDHKDALQWAEKLAAGRKVKTVKYQKR